MGMVRLHPHHCGHTTSSCGWTPESCNNCIKDTSIFALKFDMDACLYNVLEIQTKPALILWSGSWFLGWSEDSAVILGRNEQAEQILSTSLSAVPAKKRPRLMESSLKKFYNTAQKAHALPLSGRMGSTTDVSAYTDSASKAKRRRKTAIEMLREHGKHQIRIPAQSVKHLSKIGGSYPEMKRSCLNHHQHLQPASNSAKGISRQRSSTAAKTVQVGQLALTLRAEMLRDAMVVGQAAPSSFF